MSEYRYFYITENVFIDVENGIIYNTKNNKNISLKKNNLKMIKLLTQSVNGSIECVHLYDMMTVLYGNNKKEYRTTIEKHLRDDTFDINHVNRDKKNTYECINTVRKLLIKVFDEKDSLVRMKGLECHPLKFFPVK